MEAIDNHKVKGLSSVIVTDGDIIIVCVLFEVQSTDQGNILHFSTY